jgi:hypothetical protein
VNDLNSILIEGRASDCTYTEGEFRCIIMSRYTARDEEVTLTRAPIIAHGKLGETCSERIRDRYPIRIVGRIAPLESTGTLYVQAEHVEIKAIGSILVE